jgi:hypothetical protein
MYNLSICFGPTGTCWQFLFKEKEKAEEICKRLENGDESIIHRVEDDFGQRANIERAAIHAVLIEDMDAIEAAHVQRALAQARAQAKLHVAARSDPLLRTAQQAPILQPAGVGGFRN